MSRYIDADALYEQTAEWEEQAMAQVERLNRTTDEGEMAEWRKWTAILGERTAFKFDVADAPTADVVEVVRCKDCKYLVRSEDFCKVLSNNYEPPVYVDDDDFCSRGERRET